MSHRTVLGRSATALAATTLLVAGITPLASAKAPEVRASGTCTAGATWKLKAKGDNGRIEVQLEVDSNRAGQTWTWSLTDNGVKVGSGTTTTVAPSGSFEVGRRIANRAGTDRLVATARHAATGQTCRGSVAFPG